MALSLRTHGPRQLQFWIVALVIGIAAGSAALLFRKAIGWLQTFFYGTDDVMLASHAETLAWWVILLIPVAGGLAVGLVLHFFTPDGRARSVADVIEGAALHDGRVEKRAGLASVLASLITLSTGGSTGREGPVVHMAGVISSWVSDRMKASGIEGRDLLGCAVAAAVSASFNAPIAGMLFALEVVLRHFAVHAFAPIAIASVAGTVINRMEYGDITEFRLPEAQVLGFYAELPAFLMLGLLSGLVAVVMMRAIFWTDDLGSAVQRATGLPRWLRPALAGLLLGLIAIWFPHIIGVGYETTLAALSGDILFWNAVVFAVIKVAAVAVTLGGRMGGGVFSPALMVGALLGLAFGHVATAVVPEMSGSETLYALAGMGAVTAAVLGAPISTTVIVFELTGDWQTGIAVLVAVSMSSALASRLVHRSFFLTQLMRRDVQLAAGPQAYLLRDVPVRAVMRPLSKGRGAGPAHCEGLVAEGLWVAPDLPMPQAMRRFESSGAEVLAVALRPFGEGSAPHVVGSLHRVDALARYARALSDTAREEHS